LGIALKCEVCGIEVDLPFRCSFCNEYFCAEHRIPENHSCPQTPPRTPLGHWKAKIRKLEAKELPTLPRKTQAEETTSCPKCASERVQITAYRKEGIHYLCLDCGFKWKQPRLQTTLKPTRKKKFVIVGATTFAVIMIVVFAVSIFVYFPMLKNENDLPIASFTSSKTADIFIGKEIIFNASSSYDPDNSQTSGITTYSWDFGDGTPVEVVSSCIVTHSFTLIRKFNVTLTVIDDDGQNSTCTKCIEVKWGTPTISELSSWLTLDQTNEMDYDYPYFVCFDFAKMLANHSRQKNWKMALVLINGSDISTTQEWYHAVNAINTTEGLVYIEPQTDDLWWCDNYVEMVSGNTYRFWDHPYESVYVYITDILVLHLEDLEEYLWIRPSLSMKSIE